MALDRDLKQIDTGKKKKAKKNTLSKDGAAAAEFFKEAFSPSKRIKKDNYTKKGMQQQAGDFLDVKKLLREFKPGEVQAKDVTVLGKKITIVQHSDNSLAIMEGGQEYALEVTAAYAADRIESDMAGNDELYGQAAVKDLFASMDTVAISGDKAELSRVRQLMTAFLRNKTGIATAELSNIPLERLRTYAINAAEGMLTAKEIQADIKDFEYDTQQNSYINTEEMLQTEKIGSGNDPRVEMHLQKKEEEKGWTAEEQSLLDFFADLIFDQQTWTADQKTEKGMSAGESMRTLLSRHVEALRFLLKKPDEVDEMIRKLPLPDVMIKVDADDDEDDEADEDEGKEQVELPLKEAMSKGLRKMLDEPAIKALSLLPDSFFFKDLFKGELIVSVRNNCLIP